MTNKKISITKIKNDDIREAVFEALELINAEDLLTNEDMNILIKPNILMGKEPSRAVNTHPEVIKAVIRWLKKHGQENITVGESSGTSNPGATKKAFGESGIKKICEEEEVDWTPFEETERKKYQVSNPLVLNEFYSSPLIDTADLIINIPKIKTHWQCLLTCCIKNMFGTLILGNKAKTHAKYPNHEAFSSALTDIYSVSRPQLTVVDGFLCQEGKGPSQGEVVKMDLIMAGFDPVALDTAVCKIIGFDPNEVHYIEKAEEKGLGTSNLDHIEILGKKIQEVRRDFKRPRLRPISVPLPGWLADYMGDVIFRSSVKFDSEKCKLCSTCWDNCPANAISPPEEIKKGNTPKWNKEKCIFCYCCAELCPHEAVNFKINYIKNFLFSWAGVIFIIILSIIMGIILWIFLPFGL
jgi:uncharacterized protein (DUF362 family)/Pyruvate/2-oxoacid:ferredoxin oxidoreductase delta subunit